MLLKHLKEYVTSRYLLFAVIFLYTLCVLLPELNIPLVSYDEAWYASIAHNILEKSEVLAQSFNGSAYYDHPPLGFWLMSTSMLLFGESEFSIRLPSIIAGIGTLILVYELARSWTSKSLGIVPTLMLASSLWFAYRTRSSNLDVLLTFFMTYAVWSMQRLLDKPSSIASRAHFGFAIFGTIMIKTLVGLGVLPALIYMYVHESRKTKKANLNKAVFQSLLAAGICILPWYLYNSLIHQDFLKHHFLTIGTRKGSDNAITLSALKQTLLYVRSGIGKWYIPSLIGTALSIPIWIRSRFDHKLSINLIWFLGVGFPFFMSAKTEVWHLIPLYVPLFLLTTSVIHHTIAWVRQKPLSLTLKSMIVIATVLIAFVQTQNILPLLRASTEYDHKDIALRSQNITTPVSINAPFLPTFVYYSKLENVHPLFLDPTSYATIIACLETKDCNTVFVINKSDKERLETDGHSFKIKENNAGYYLIQNIQE